jgi:hypothetical protein
MKVTITVCARLAGLRPAFWRFGGLNPFLARGCAGEPKGCAAEKWMDHMVDMMFRHRVLMKRCRFAPSSTAVPALRCEGCAAAQHTAVWGVWLVIHHFQTFTEPSSPPRAVFWCGLGLHKRNIVSTLPL